MSLSTRARIWSTSIGVKSSELVGLGLAMHTEGTVGMRFQLVGQVGDPIAMVLLAGVGGGRGVCYKDYDRQTQPWVEVVIWRGRGMVVE